VHIEGEGGVKMEINQARLQKAQELMRQQGMLGLMIMNHDDYQYFFGETRVQPRAIIPAWGEPILICFKAEEEEIRSALGSPSIKVFSHVGEQMSDVKNTFKALFGELPPIFCKGTLGPRWACRCGSIPRLFWWTCSVRSTRIWSWYHQIR
jgi:Xaa-Pro aminopeptidase